MFIFFEELKTYIYKLKLMHFFLNGEESVSAAKYTC